MSTTMQRALSSVMLVLVLPAFAACSKGGGSKSPDGGGGNGGGNGGSGGNDSGSGGSGGGGNGGGGAGGTGGSGGTGGGPAAFVPTGPARKDADLTKMARIPGGTFRMGYPEDNPVHGDYGQPWKPNELPGHQVTLPEFYIDKDEVTVGAYAEFLTAVGGETHRHLRMPITVSASGYAPAAGSTQRPIAFVSWHDATTYCAWAGKRLPTEAEWERAARGPTNTTYPWGEGGLDCAHAVAFIGGSFCEPTPRDVGSRSPKGDSPEGLRDMVGNVAEWVSDVYGDYTADAATDPKGPATGRYRVIRGGGFHEAPNELRATARWAANLAGKSEGVGFRCAARK